MPPLLIFGRGGAAKRRGRGPPQLLPYFSPSVLAFCTTLEGTLSKG